MFSTVFSLKFNKFFIILLSVLDKIHCFSQSSTNIDTISFETLSSLDFINLFISFITDSNIHTIGKSIYDSEYIIGENSIPKYKENLVANTFGSISPKNNIKKVIFIDIMKNHIQADIQKLLVIPSHILPAYIDNTTFIRLLPINIVINVFSGFFFNLSNNLAYLLLFLFLFTSCLTLYNGIHIIANSAPENTAAHNNNNIKIQMGDIYFKLYV
jgi:hypothetical protein